MPDILNRLNARWKSLDPSRVGLDIREEIIDAIDEIARLRGDKARLEKRITNLRAGMYELMERDRG